MFFFAGHGNSRLNRSISFGMLSKCLLLNLLIWTTITLTSWTGKAYAKSELVNRLGVGTSNQLINNIHPISFKMQKSDQFAFGLLLGLSTSDVHGGYGAGLKAYRILFIEPNLNFYSSLLLALINNKTSTSSTSGFQVDGTLGCEFHLPGLQSIGLSFEFGISINRMGEEFAIETAGHHFTSAGIHFYL